MSAWIVSKRHIDALVTYAHQQGVKKGDRNAIGRLLWKENFRSVNARYGERDKAPSYSFAPRPVTHTEALKAARCFNYQTCETDDWETTKAFAVIQAIIAQAERNGADTKSKEYNDAPWGIES